MTRKATDTQILNAVITNAMKISDDPLEQKIAAFFCLANGVAKTGTSNKEFKRLGDKLTKLMG